MAQKGKARAFFDNVIKFVQWIRKNFATFSIIVILILVIIYNIYTLFGPGNAETASKLVLLFMAASSTYIIYIVIKFEELIQTNHATLHGRIDSIGITIDIHKMAGERSKKIKDLIEKHTKITNEYLVYYKDLITNTTLNRLTDIDEKQCTGEVDAYTIFTQFSIPRLKKLGPTDKVKAITFLYKPAKEKKLRIWNEYFQENKMAAERGANVERIFIKKYQSLDPDFWKHPTVKDHLIQVDEQDKQNLGKMRGLYLDKTDYDNEKITIGDNQFFDKEEIRYGFMMINDEVAFLDRFDKIDENEMPVGKYRLVIHCGENKIKQIETVFEALRIKAEPLNEDHIKALDYANMPNKIPSADQKREPQSHEHENKI